MRDERHGGEEVEHDAINPAKERRRRREQHDTHNDKFGVEDEEPGEASADHATDVAHAPTVLARRKAVEAEATAEGRAVAANVRVLLGLLPTRTGTTAGADDDR